MGDETKTPTTSPTSPRQTHSVLVTSFGPFPNGRGGHYNINASNEIAKALPSHIEFDIPSTTSSSTTKHGADTHDPQKQRRRRVRVNVLNPTAEKDAYVKTEYGYTRRYIEQLHDDIDALSPLLGRRLLHSPNRHTAVPHHPHTPPPSTTTTTPSPITSPTLIIHLGQASYCNNPPSLGLERLAFSQSMRSSWWSAREAQEGYHRISDDRGETIEDIDAGKDPWAAKDVPIGLGTALDIDEIASYARAALTTLTTPTSSTSSTSSSTQNIASNSTLNNVSETSSTPSGIKKVDEHKKENLNIITHHEPGPYLCGFIYYESLAQCYIRKKRADVLFCHVPAMLGEEEVSKGRDAVVAVVEGAVRWLVEEEETRVGKREELKNEARGDELRESEDRAGKSVEDVL